MPKRARATADSEEKLEAPAANAQTVDLKIPMEAFVGALKQALQDPEMRSMIRDMIREEMKSTASESESKGM